MNDELISSDTDKTNHFGKEWQIRVDVYYTGTAFNVEVEIMELYAGLFQAADTYTRVKRADEKEDIDDTIQAVIEELFDYAGDTEEARDLEIDVSVD